MDLGLRGKVALVVGGSRGIGKAIAHSLAAEGARLVLTARGAEALEATAESLRGEGAEVHTVALDVTSETAGTTLVEEAMKAYGRVDILVGNAGGNRPRLFSRSSSSRIAAFSSVNEKKRRRCSRAAIQRWTICTATATLALSRGLRGRAGTTAVS